MLHHKLTMVQFAWILSIVPIIVHVTVTIILFSTKYRIISPDFRFFQPAIIKDIMGLGVKFFFIQVSIIILFQSGNIIIARMLGPSEVTEYNIAYKYFSVIYMLFNIYITPHWPAFTKAWTLGQTKWIMDNLKKNILFWLTLLFIGTVMLIFSQQVFHIWIGPNISISKYLCCVIYLYIFLHLRDLICRLMEQEKYLFNDQ